MASRNLSTAKKDRFDEFYTKFEDIERELAHYKRHFKNKIVFCPCDEPKTSNFYLYFLENFKSLGLKKLISLHYTNDKQSHKVEVESGKKLIKTPLKQNGDFRSDEAKAILRQSDIVVTNPPFSLLREFVKQLFAYRKKFAIIANINLITCKEIFPLLATNKMWLGYKMGAQEFEVPQNYARDNSYQSVDGRKYAKFGNICWLTNLDIDKRHKSLLLHKTYNAQDYPRYDHYHAIEVSRVDRIPRDYNGVMGVPITFLYKHNPTQFEILGLDRYMSDSPHYGKRFSLRGKETYARVMIRRIGA